MHTRSIFATFGASSGFSLAALWEWARSPSAASSLAFIGSVVSTLIAWCLARRQEINQARRQEEFLDAINRAAIGRLTAGGPIDVQAGLDPAAPIASAP